MASWPELVVPLTVPDSKAEVPEGQKTLNEVAYLTMRALISKSSLPKLTDAITLLLASTEDPDGRIEEDMNEGRTFSLV